MRSWAKQLSRRLGDHRGDRPGDGLGDDIGGCCSGGQVDGLLGGLCSRLRGEPAYGYVGCLRDHGRSRMRDCLDSRKAVRLLGGLSGGVPVRDPDLLLIRERSELAGGHGDGLPDGHRDAEACLWSYQGSRIGLEERPYTGRVSDSWAIRGDDPEVLAEIRTDVFNIAAPKP